MQLLETIYQKALTARENAYAPYSAFKVGAALCSESGQIYAACNVENASYPCGTCAEAGAISMMVAAGEKKIKDIVVVADSQILITPCGACLQRISEFSDEETMIHLADLRGIVKSYKFCELLPVSFHEENLKR